MIKALGIPLLSLSLALAGCAVAPSASDAGRLTADNLFAPPSQPVDAGRVFAVSDAMRRYIVQKVDPLQGTRSRQRALFDALRARDELRLEYDAAYTRTAAEAFDARTGNCLSLVIMTGAFAHQLGVQARYRVVNVEETWARRGDIYFSIGHVNITLGRRVGAMTARFDDSETFTVDFQPPPNHVPIGRWQEIEEKTVLAMYLNNRAAETFADGRLDDAYWFAREAILQDPGFVAAYNTLGVVYQRRGHHAEAARALAFALEREPRNTNVMSNLANAYASLGRAQEADALRERIARLDPEPAFAWFNQGVAAMQRGDFRAARDLFAKEVDRAPDYHEFHFWLALALANLGENEEARHHLALARDTATTREEHELYAAKLRRIRSARAH
jgi:tetratricopeptide (TPR) repeat protein